MLRNHSLGVTALVALLQRDRGASQEPGHRTADGRREAPAPSQPPGPGPRGDERRALDRPESRA